MSTVSIRKTTGDDYAAIKAAVDQVIADIGGIEDIIKPGYKVIIKPNLVACPTDRLSGGVTRWEVCLAIYEAVKALGAEPVIAESSAAGADTELTIAKCGYQELRDKGIPVIDLKQKENARCTVEIEDGEVFKKINTWELVRDADAIITVPVMKTHDQTEVTLGMKNLKGLLVDTQKKDFHKKGLIEGVVDWNLHLKPCLEIIDGTYGQQGLGPIFGEMDLEKIEVIGETIEGVASRFKRSSEVEIEGIPTSFNLIFSKDACTGCHNTVISSLMDMKAQNLFPYLENMNVCVGPVTEDMLPADANADNTVCIGVCCKKLADAKGFRWVVGCPPGQRRRRQGHPRRPQGVRRSLRVSYILSLFTFKSKSRGYSLYPRLFI